MREHRLLQANGSARVAFLLLLHYGRIFRPRSLGLLPCSHMAMRADAMPARGWESHVGEMMSRDTKRWEGSRTWRGRVMQQQEDGERPVRAFSSPRCEQRGGSELSALHRLLSVFLIGFSPVNSLAQQPFKIKTFPIRQFFIFAIKPHSKFTSNPIHDRRRFALELGFYDKNSNGSEPANVSQLIGCIP